MTALALRRTLAPEAEDFALSIPAAFRLASGDVLDERDILARRIGPRVGPQIVVLGGISAGRDVCGKAGWWRDTLIAHDGVDLASVGVIGFDFSPARDQRVRITPADQARLIAFALQALGVERLHAFVGASYGGMVGLAFAALFPERLDRLCVLCAGHRPSAQALAWRGVQRRIVEFGLDHGDGSGALALSRQLGMITYRTAAEFEERFGAGVDASGRGEVDRYLEARGGAYAQVMAPHRWLSLSESIDRFCVDPTSIETPTTLIACETDQLAPLAGVQELASRLPRVRALHVISSLYGHDAFLKEPAKLGPLIRRFLQETTNG